jgi:PIN domain nuclease of toxin-antitoxin system
MLVDGDRFASRVLRRIEAAGPRGNLYIASVTIWEIAMLVQKGSLRLNRPTLDWVTTAVHESSVVVASRLSRRPRRSTHRRYGSPFLRDARDP